MKNFSLGENVIGEVYESGDEVILYISGTGTAITTRVNHGVGNKKDI